MEINITRLFAPDVFAPRDYSASVAEIGHDAGPSTWLAACEDAADYGPMLDTADRLEAARNHFEGFGAWDRDEIDAWTDNEVNAIFLQEVAASMREFTDDLQSWDWTVYETESSRGNVNGSLYQGTDGRVYFYLGS